MTIKIEKVSVGKAKFRGFVNQTIQCFFSWAWGIIPIPCYQTNGSLSDPHKTYGMIDSLRFQSI